MKKTTKNYIISNYDAIQFLTDDEIAALVVGRFCDSDVEGVLVYIASKQYQDSHAFNISEIGQF